MNNFENNNIENINFNVNVYEDEGVDACIRNLRKDASSLADMSLGIEDNTSEIKDNTSEIKDNTSEIKDNTSEIKELLVKILSVLENK